MSDLVNLKVRMTDDGVVLFPGGMMHPYTFRDLMGEEAYQELLSRPRVRSPYSDDEENKDGA